MKKLIFIGIGFALAIAVFGLVGLAYAQIQEPPDDATTSEPEFPYGRAGWSRGSHGGPMNMEANFTLPGMMAFGMADDETGPLHEYLWPAIAEAFGLSNAQIEAFEIVRETVQGIRADLSQDEIRETMRLAMTNAVEAALADGVITEEQAARWLERLDQMNGLPGLPFGQRGGQSNFRQGFVRGAKFGRQMMINHAYLDAAIAAELGISVEKLQAMRAEKGFNLKDYAEEQGLSVEAFRALHTEIFTNAVHLALADGAITPEQAEWLLERLENFESRDPWFDQP